MVRETWNNQNWNRLCRGQRPCRLIVAVSAAAKRRLFLQKGVRFDAYESQMNNSIMKYFEVIEDKREPWKVRHNLLEIIFITIVATICRAETWQEIAAFAEEKATWFQITPLLLLLFYLQSSVLLHPLPSSC